MIFMAADATGGSDYRECNTGLSKRGAAPSFPCRM